MSSVIKKDEMLGQSNIHPSSKYSSKILSKSCRNFFNLGLLKTSNVLICHVNIGQGEVAVVLFEKEKLSFRNEEIVF